MTDNTLESELTRRKGFETIVEDEAENMVKTSEEETKKDSKAVEVKGTWQTIKYYFNRFRYYHWIVADTIDKYVSAALLWIINMYLKYFMGVGPEPPSVLSEQS